MTSTIGRKYVKVSPHVVVCCCCCYWDFLLLLVVVASLTVQCDPVVEGGKLTTYRKREGVGRYIYNETGHDVPSPRNNEVRSSCCSRCDLQEIRKRERDNLLFVR